MATIPPVPRTNTVLKGLKQTIEFIWDNWFQGLANAVNAAGQVLGTVSLATQAATVSTTAIVTPTLAAGLYRVTYYARITRASGATSSLTPAFQWTDGGVACSQSGAAMTGNTTSTTQSGVLAMAIDAGTTLRYSLTYASTGAPTMQYSFSARAEALP